MWKEHRRGVSDAGSSLANQGGVRSQQEKGGKLRTGTSSQFNLKESNQSLSKSKEGRIVTSHLRTSSVSGLGSSVFSNRVKNGLGSSPRNKITESAPKLTKVSMKCKHFP